VRGGDLGGGEVNISTAGGLNSSPVELTKQTNIWFKIKQTWIYSFPQTGYYDLRRLCGNWMASVRENAKYIGEQL
jgi:hypothetical protein